MAGHGKEIAVYSGSSNPVFAQHICTELGIKLGTCHLKTFADGEISFRIDKSVRGKDVFIIQSTCKPVNNNLVELMIMIDAFRRASAERITAVIPYFGYARQDRKARSREPISAKLVANLLTTAGADRILTIDLHAPQIQGFFDIPLDHIEGADIFTEYLKNKYNVPYFNNEEYCVVSPDVGSANRSRSLANTLHMGLAIVEKSRPRPNECEVMNIIGDVRGKICVIFDDIVDTAGTLCNAAEAIKNAGAKEVYVCASHAVLSGDAIERIENSCIKEVRFLNTIPMPADYTGSKIIQLDAATLTAKFINKIHKDEPVSDLFIK